MAKLYQVSSQSRKKLSNKILDAINEIGEDKIISIIIDEGGKFASSKWGNEMLAKAVASIYYKEN